MPRFAYAAIDSTGNAVEGMTKADTIGSARAVLVEQNLFPTKIEERRGLLDFELTKEKVKKKELMHFTRQLAVFVKAGIPITDALVVIGDETEDVALRRALSALVDDLRNGGLFSAAAAHAPRGVPRLLRRHPPGRRTHRPARHVAREPRRLPGAGDRNPQQGGVGPVVPDGRHGDGHRSPSLILAGYVLPQFKPLFEELDADLPLPTRMMLFFSRFFTDLWFITAAFFLVIGTILVFLFKHPTGPSSGRTGSSCKIPIIKGIVDYAILERFCRILAAMVKAGVPLPEGLKTTTEACSNVVYRERLEVAREQMLEGRGFSGPLIETELFPGAAKQMFKVGEETGTLDDQLETASMYFDRELESRIKKFTTMFEPLMIVFVGLIVGFVAVALVSAMYGVLNGTKASI